MAGVNLSRPLLEAGASAKCDFAAADARTGLDFDLDLKFKRGAKLEIGVGAYADASAEFSKFIHASIAGTAFAEARAGVQLQLPLNLFDEFGFSARAEAIAQAAAGLEVNLGLSVGDFVAMAKRDPDFFGVPLEMFMLLLEEVAIGGAFEVNVSASAKAHASLSVAGTIIERGGDKAGFYYTVDAGVGLAAGVGMGGKVGLEFKDFRRFLGRAVDVVVDKTVDDIAQILAPAGNAAGVRDQVRKSLHVFAPVAKIALRTAYDLGLKIAERNPGATQDAAAELCNDAIRTLLEESQRFVFAKLLDAACDSLRLLVEAEARRMGSGAWDALLPARTALSDQLLALPPEPFQSTPENAQYWIDVVDKALALVTALGSPDPKLNAMVGVVYAASELLIEAIRAKVNKASAYAGAIGAGTVTADTKPFVGVPVNQATRAIRVAIAGTDRQLAYDDLIAFLASSAIVDPMLAAVPALEGFVKIFEGEFGKTGKEVFALLVQNAAAFDLSGAGASQVDPRALLVKIVDALDAYMTGRFEAEVLPLVLAEVDDPNLRLYMNEVLYPAVVYMKDVGLKSVLSWSDPARGFDNEDFTEALAGVLMLLFGRTVIVTGDTLMTALQDRADQACQAVAQKFRAGHSDIARFGIPAELTDIAIDCLEVAGTVLGPLPDDTRKRLRRLLYQVFEPIPPGEEADFLERLADDFFIPKEADMRALTDELTQIAKDRFVLFVRAFAQRIGEYILGLLEAFIDQVVDMVLDWEKTLADGLNRLAALLHSLEQRIVDLNREVIELFTAARDAIHAFLALLSGPNLRSKVKSEIKGKFVDKALDALEDNGAYQALPGGVRSAVRGLVGGAVNAAMQSPVLDPVFASVNAIAGQLDTLLPDVRSLDPEDNLPEQLMDLVLDRIEQNIRAHFGGGKPGITLTLDYAFSVWIPDDIFGNGHWETRHIVVSLGRIEVNLNPFIDAVRSAIRSLDFYHDALDNACFRLADAMAKELELAATQLVRDKKKARKDKLQRISDEHANAPKEIALLAPLNMEHFTSDIEFRIHLGGVPVSYLGLGDSEAARVLIYVNSHLVPVKSLVVEQSLSVVDVARHGVDIDLSAGPNTFANGKVRIVADTGREIPGQRQSAAARAQPTSFTFAAGFGGEERVAKTAYVAPVKTGAGQVTLNRSTSTKKSGRTVHSYAFENLKPGGLKAASTAQDVLADRLPGMLLQFTVALDEPFIVQGINVLTVVVIERGGHRHQQSVTFSVGVPVKAPTRRPVLAVPIAGLDKLSIAGVARARIEASKDIASNDIRDEMVSRIGKSASQVGTAAAVKPVKVRTPPEDIRVRKEVLVVRDRTGKEVGRQDVEYRNAAERLKAIRASELDSRALAAAGLHVTTEKITYATVSSDARARTHDVNLPLHLDAATVERRMRASLEYLSLQHELHSKALRREEPAQ